MDYKNTPTDFKDWFNSDSNLQIKDICKKYDVSYRIANRWLQESSIDYNKATCRKPIPDDFSDFLKEKPSKTDIKRKYKVDLEVVERWLKLVDVKIIRKKEVPDKEELISLNQTKNTAGLAEHYKVSISLIQIWFGYYEIPLKKFSNNSSGAEKEFVNFINELCPGFHSNKKSILENKKLELDAYHPELKIAFEFDGVYWHSMNDKNDHYNKYQDCLSKDIILYRFIDSEWFYKKDLVKSMIRARLNKIENKIHGRKTILKMITRQEANSFHDVNHIAEAGNSSVNLGLFYNDTLVSVMSFCRSRYGGYEWEISRFSTLQNHLVIGGAVKLFKHFVENYDPKTVISFCDNRLGTGKVYERLNFTKIKDGPPTYWYYNDRIPGKRFSRQAFQKNKLEKKLKKFDEKLTEVENMKINGYYQYWDCGSNHYLWEKK